MTTNITQSDTSRPTTSTDAPWTTASPKAASRLRAMKRRRSIPHLLLGVLLVLACAAAFAVVSLNSGNRESVLALARPVSVGQVLMPQDLKQVNVAVDPEVSVVDVRQAAGLVGRTLSVSLPAGALLTRDAVSGAGLPAAGQAIAALPLKAGQFPPQVSPGSHVSVVFVPGQTGTAMASPPSPDAMSVWPAVVAAVTSSPNQQTSVVSVQLSQAAALQIAAVTAGQLSIVMLSGGE
ncbi:SAF domain-containing protein [Amycolatopsis pigmentata]|uniref:SAF domain-containing protein n=1 Tax=Amycolatopsis pigmentata TaxID=450801 RepID=A0ABW5FWL3_9PSEU